MTTWPRLGRVLGAAVIVLLLLEPTYRIDLDVYRIGAQVWMHGGALYGQLPATSVGIALPFTYPPMAAVLLAPLALVPMWLAALVLTVTSMLLVRLLLRVFAASVSARAGDTVRRWSFLLFPAALLLEPIRSTLGYGQVNVILMALVAVDCLAPPSRLPRGVLVGLAAALKLTPAVFVLFFLLRKDFRAARNAALSFAVVCLAGFVLAPSASITYWTTTLFDTGRIGGSDYAGNQSITGVLARLDLAPALRTPLWLALSAAVMLLAAVGMRRAIARRQYAEALLLNAFAGLLVSPVSWSHHWVLGVMAVLVLGLRGWEERSRGGLVLAGAGLLTFAISAHWWLPNQDHRELRWAWWEQVVGSSYVWYALVVLVVAAVPRRPAARPARPARPLADASGLTGVCAAADRSGGEP